ncbi:unnamed protein product [Cunninghamella echinulata]
MKDLEFIQTKIYNNAITTWTRITQTKYSIACVLLILTSTLIGIVLQCVMASSHASLLSTLEDEFVKRGGDLAEMTSVLSWSSNIENDLLLVLLELRRLKDENVFFALLTVFQVYLGIDAISRQSVIQLMAHTVLELVSVIFASTQLKESLECQRLAYQFITTNEFPKVIRISIAIIVLYSVFTLIFAYLCKILLQDIGWHVYKRLGADIEQQKRYRLAQVFLLAAKLDAFFHLIFSVFFIVVMTQEKIYMHGGGYMFWYIFHIFLTVSQLPSYITARKGVIHERVWLMNSILVLQALYSIDFIIILQQTATSWSYWVVAVLLALALSIITIVLTIYVKRNFNKGLVVHMKHILDEDLSAPPRKSGQFDGPRQSWLIDDDEHDFISPTITKESKIEVDHIDKTEMDHVDNLYNP